MNRFTDQNPYESPIVAELVPIRRPAASLAWIVLVSLVVAVFGFCLLTLAVYVLSLDEPLTPPIGYFF
jgi:hypothetical protein